MARGLADRPWVSGPSERRVGAVADRAAGATAPGLLAELDRLVAENRRIHQVDSINLNPAANIMSPRAEAVLSAGSGSRPSMGHPGDKYETGLEAIEQIEVIAAELAAEVFAARYAEVRVPSGSIANLYALMATCGPGATVIAPPVSIGGHVAEHDAGSVGPWRLSTVPAPVAPGRYTVDVDALRSLAHRVRPALITVGGSLNLYPHPVTAVREIADEVGARVLFDAAHVCGLVAGRAWPNPLDHGAHLMTMSTYKSLGGPPGGLLLTDDAELAERLDAIAFPGLTANVDAARVAALAVTLVDWTVAGRDYAAAMVATARRLAGELAARGVPVFAGDDGPTRSHQFALVAHRWGGGRSAAHRLRRANLLACGIGLPVAPVEGEVNGLRIGTPELVRLGMTEADMPELAELIADGLDPDGSPEAVVAGVGALRARFSGVHFTADLPS